MKRIIAILISTMFFMTTVAFANAKIPEELMKYLQNFTAAYSVSMVIDDNSDIRALLDEIVGTDGLMSGTVATDFVSLISAMFEYDGKMYLQADMDSDFKKIKFSLTNSSTLSSVVSSNLNYTVNSNAGIWLDMDFSDEVNPKLDMILQSPTADKYYCINAGNYISQEDLNLFMESFNTEEFKNLYDNILHIFYENIYAEQTKNGYKISMDNEEFVKCADEILDCVLSSQTGDVQASPLSFEGMNFLGKDGIQAEYRLKGGKVVYAEVNTDISLDISSIVKAIGGDWPYNASGKINVKLTEKADYTKIGQTVVAYPVVNEGNSISLNSLIENRMQLDNYEGYTFEYPYWSASAYCDALPVVDGEFYVPLRAILEDGYDESVAIDYNNGVITATSEYFAGFKTLALTVGTDKVYTDAVEHTVGDIILVDGVTYVNASLFTDVFGWELTDVTHELISNTYSVTFDTNKY